MKSLVTKRSIVVGGHKTSVSLEGAFWNGLKEVAASRKVTYLVGSIDSERVQGNLSSAVRLFVLDYYRSKIAAAAGTRGSDVEATLSADSAKL
jgi:predicted DNA-binding ribbon-helix-helix protein